MKRITYILLVFVTILALFACAKKGSIKPEEETPLEPKVVTVSCACGYDSIEMHFLFSYDENKGKNVEVYRLVNIIVFYINFDVDEGVALVNELYSPYNDIPGVAVRAEPSATTENAINLYLQLDFETLDLEAFRAIDKLSIDYVELAYKNTVASFIVELTKLSFSCIDFAIDN